MAEMRELKRELSQKEEAAAALRSELLREKTRREKAEAACQAASEQQAESEAALQAARAKIGLLAERVNRLADDRRALEADLEQKNKGNYTAGSFSVLQQLFWTKLLSAMFILQSINKYSVLSLYMQTLPRVRHETMSIYDLQFIGVNLIDFVPVHAEGVT